MRGSLLVPAAVLWVPLLSLADAGTRAIFGHFAADSFYYLVIARNALRGAPSSFDGTTLTNGYHPLWQGLLSGLFLLLPDAQSAQLLATYLLSAGLVAAGLLLFALAIRRVTGSALAALWMVPGLFHLAFSLSSPGSVDPGLTYTYSVWALANGMETPLTVVLAGLLAWRLSAPSLAKLPLPAWPERAWLGFGGLAALAVLARLDDVFLPLALAVCVLAAAGSPRARIRRAALVLAPTGAAVAVYLAVNRVAIGTALPVSGQIKGGWPLLANVSIVLTDLLPFLRHLPGSDYDPAGWIYSAQRSVLLVVPALFALGALMRIASRAASPALRRLAPFAPLLLHVVLKACYNLARVEIAQQGWWYHAWGLLLFDFLAVILIAHALRGRGARRALAAAWVATWLVAGANAIHRAGGPHWGHDVWLRREVLRAALLEARPEARIVDFHDGLFAFALDRPAMAATALVTDVTGLRALRAGDYPRSCLARGHDVAVSAPQAYPVGVEWLRAGRSRVLHRDGPTGVTFTQIRPAS